MTNEAFFAKLSSIIKLSVYVENFAHDLENSSDFSLEGYSIMVDDKNTDNSMFLMTYSHPSGFRVEIDVFQEKARYYVPLQSPDKKIHHDLWSKMCRSNLDYDMVETYKNEFLLEIEKRSSDENGRN